jgi:predicted ATPase
VPALASVRSPCAAGPGDGSRRGGAGEGPSPARSIEENTIPALLALLDALPADSPFLQLDPPQRRQRTLEAVKRVLLRESQVQPLLLVFEDLHWIDAETQALLDALVDSLPTARVLLLVNYRPEYQHGWGSKTSYTQLRLDPLPPASAEAFLQALMGDDPSLPPLKRLLSERTAGNPFFLEESVRTLVETHVLVGERGAYRPPAGGKETSPPDRCRDWHGGALPPLAGHCRGARGGAARGPDAPPGGGIPL